MRLLSLDYIPLYGDEDDQLSEFNSDISCFDFDLVFWDPQGSFNHYDNPRYGINTYKGLPSLSEYASAAIKSDVDRRHHEFAEFLESGRTLIVFGRPPQSCYVETGEVRTSGTGRNAQRTRMVEKFDILNALPFEAARFKRASGSRIEPAADGPIQQLFRKYAEHLKYSATLSDLAGTTLARVQGTNRAVSSVLKTSGGGHLFILPTTTFKPKVSTNTDNKWDEGNIEEWPEIAADFQQDLLYAIQEAVGSEEFTRPSWAGDYVTATVHNLQGEVEKQQKSVERANSRLTKARNNFESVLQFDQLYLGTGRQLELRVADVMRHLGGTPREPEQGRADWQVDFGETVAVLEVKGVSKSAAEKHAAQLEKWVAGAFEISGKSPKGILVVNTWRDTPLDKRIRVDFPEQMLSYSKARGHCLMTGLELFLIMQEISSNPERKEYWLEKILTTIGRLTDMPDWQEFFQATAPITNSNGPEILGDS